MLKPFDFLDPNVLVKEGDDESARFNNSVMRLASDHPILDEILDRWRRPWKAVPWQNPRKAWPVITMSLTSLGPYARHLPWGALGADAIEHCIRKNGFDGTVLGQDRSLTSYRTNLFAPTSNPDQYLGPEIVYVHLYRSQVRVDLSSPAQGSIYARLWDLR
ncbi:hypothetical protein [Hyphomicrobium sp.]|uniref:hypothetical protein n=1 Tax=Hyphomicrobium sp. TaxID=82 RepID=UPI000F9E44BD|nr:hypothetical protein [Hyphomicrobium sp.]RUO97837.1 MAG: hypothetical protein EKK30_13960 [Hyphomicrobium sp.]